MGVLMDSAMMSQIAQQLADEAGVDVNLFDTEWSIIALPDCPADYSYDMCDNWADVTAEGDDAAYWETQFTDTTFNPAAGYLYDADQGNANLGELRTLINSSAHFRENGICEDGDGSIFGNPRSDYQLKLFTIIGSDSDPSLQLYTGAWTPGADARQSYATGTYINYLPCAYGCVETTLNPNPSCTHRTQTTATMVSTRKSWYVPVRYTWQVRLSRLWLPRGRARCWAQVVRTKVERDDEEAATAKQSVCQVAVARNQQRHHRRGAAAASLPCAAGFLLPRHRRRRFRRDAAGVRAP